MILKRAYATSGGDDAAVRLVTPGSGIKTAGLLPAVQSCIDSLRPDPAYTYALVNAMGYSEYFGANSNKDWYGYNPHLDFNGLLHAWDGIGSDPVADKIRGKTWPYGYPCFYNAAVYAHHKNTDPVQLGFGDVIFAHANPEMKRIELVLKVVNADAEAKGHSSILDRLRAGERCDVSMGTKVPFDLCSVCTDWDEVKRAWATFDPQKHLHPGIAILAYHKTVKKIRGLAVTRADYCSCMTTQGGKILPSGQKVFVYNDFCRFFDISFVWIGADRTARVMWHLSHSSIPVRKPTPAVDAFSRALEALFLRASGKAAAMEKEIPGGLAEAVQRDAASAPRIRWSAMRISGNADPKRILSTLAALGIVVSPSEFQDLVLDGQPGGELLRQALEKRSAVFDATSTDNLGIDDSLAVSAADFDPAMASAASAMMAERSCFSPYLNPRLYNDEPSKIADTKVALRTALLDKIAAQYNGYRVSILENAGDLFPKSAAYMGPDVFLQEKTAVGAGFAGLLLALAPMIHLLSAHLRGNRDSGEQLGAMAQLVADNPTFTSLATIGAGIRAAMAIEGAGGLLPAVKSVVSAVRGVL